jgi:hypothetical protein
MQQYYKRRLITLLLISSGILTACNQVGSSTSASSTQQVTKDNNIETQKLLRVVNHIGSTFDHINIVTESGQVVFKSTTGLNCANNQNCNIDINGLVTEKNMLAKFYNNKNQLISMSSLKDNSQKLKFSTVYTNNTIFGAHLFSQLMNFEKANQSNINAPDLLQKLTHFFKNSKNNADVFGELGAYYSQQLAIGAINSKKAFYSSLSNDLAHGKSISIKRTTLFTNQLLQKPLLGCNHAVAETSTKIFDTIAPFTKLIPEADMFEGLFTGASAIIQDICPSEGFDSVAAFDEINGKLDTIQQSIDTLADKVDALNGIVNDIELKKLSTTLEDYYQTDEDLYSNPYMSFLLDSDPKSTSLLQYVTELGGLDNISAINEPVLYSLFNSIGAEKLNLDKMNSSKQFNQISSIINNMCGNETGIVGDVIAKRNYCNTVTTNIGVRNALIIQLSRLRMADKIAAINTKTNPGKIFINPFGTTWPDALTAMSANFVEDLNNIDTFYKNTLIKPTKGLPEDLIVHLNAKGNPLHCEESTPSGVNGIIEWYGNSNLGDKNQYIVTKCIQDQAISRSITSRYYYVSDKGNVSNVLGMLVGRDASKPERDVTNGNKEYYNNNSNDVIPGNGGINVEDIIGYKVSAKPYIINGKESTNGYFPENDTFEYNYNQTVAVRENLWSSHSGNPVSWILWNNWGGKDLEHDVRPAGSRAYYLLKPSADRGRLSYNLWAPNYWSSTGDLYSRTTNPIALELKLGEKENQWITFGFSHEYNHQFNKYEYAGIQCLTSHNCDAWYDSNNDTSVITMKLQNGQYIDIWFKWHNQDPYIYKNIYSK